MDNLTFNKDKDMINIRLLNISDGQSLYNLIEYSRPELKNLCWSKNATLDSTIEFIKMKEQSLDNAYGIFKNNTLIGVLELRKKETMSELGYWLGTQFRGKGLMKLAVKCLVDNEIKKGIIIAHIRKTNKASFKVLKYAGLKYSHTEIWNNEDWLHLKRNKEESLG